MIWLRTFPGQIAQPLLAQFWNKRAAQVFYLYERGQRDGKATEATCRKDLRPKSAESQWHECWSDDQSDLHTTGAEIVRRPGTPGGVQ